MAYKSVRDPEKAEKRIFHFTGLDTANNKSRLAPGKAYDMLNYRVTDDMSLEKRWGSRTAHTASTEFGAATSTEGVTVLGTIETGEWYVTGMESNILVLVTVDSLLRFGQIVYTQVDDTDETYAELFLLTIPGYDDDFAVNATYAGIKFEFNGKYYFFAPRNHFFEVQLLYDAFGDGYVEVTSVQGNAYIPTIKTGVNPAGTTFTATDEDYNILGNKFRETFNGDNTSTLYYPTNNSAYGGLDSVYLIKIGASTLVEGTHFTWDSANNRVNFAGGTTPWGAPATGTDNVEITMVTGSLLNWSNPITGAKSVEVFGGEADTRIFFCGSYQYPNRYYRSALLNPFYFPWGDYDDIEGSVGITGAIGIYDKLLIATYTATYLVSYEPYNELTQAPSFPIRTLNRKYGHTGGNIVLVGEFPVLVDRKIGAYTIVSYDRSENEKGIIKIGRDVENLFVGKRGVVTQAYEVFDNVDKRELWFNKGGEILVYNYGLSQPPEFTVWYKYEYGVNVLKLLEIGNTPFMIANTTAAGSGYGLGSELYEITEYQANDFRQADDTDGVAINAYWKSGRLPVADISKYAFWDKIIVEVSNTDSSYLKTKYVTQYGVSATEFEFFGGLFNIIDMNFDDFVLDTDANANQLVYVVNENEVIYAEIWFISDMADSSIKIHQVKIMYQEQGEVWNSGI